LFLGPAPERINILLITIDTLRSDYLGCYGQEAVNTPEIDRLAAEGALFSFCVAHNPLTLPSHANILTGSDARTHGIHDNSGFRLQPEAITLAEALREAGYETAAFVGAFVLDNRFGLDQGFDLYDDYYGINREGNPLITERPAEEVVQPALRWIAERSGGPWFAWVHVFDPHAPHVVPPPFDETYRDNLYAGEVSYVDYAFAELFDHLRETGQLDSTVVVITSDHGEGLGDHSEQTHGIFAYNSTLQVPLIIRAQWLIPAGALIDRRVHHIDLMPTILESVGLPVPDSSEGESLLELFSASAPSPPPDCYFEALSASLNRGWAPLRGLFSGQWKYIDLPIPELYDMNSDPHETTNLVESRGSTARQLKNILAGMTAGEQDALSARRSEDEETRRRLQALGYLSGTSQPTDEEYGPGDDPKALIGLSNRLDQATEAAANGDLMTARTILESLTTEYPDMAVAYSQLASVLQDAGRPREAVEILERAAQ